MLIVFVKVVLLFVGVSHIGQFILLMMDVCDFQVLTAG
jgi:hypothetical protein